MADNIKNQFNQSTLHNPVFNIAGERSIPHALTPPPFQPEIFLGRQHDLQAIHDHLFAPGGNLLLLVNGEGGVGKTSVASRYFHDYRHEYAHVAWVFTQKSIADALLLLALPLGLRFDERMDTEQRLEALLAEMANLRRPCLLVLDNANEPADLEAHYQRLRRCSNFHLLLTTRITQFRQAATHRIEGLPESLEMFERHFRTLDEAERALFEEIKTAVGGNTLVLELLAKNLAALNRLRPRYALADLLADLRQRGLLLLSQSAEVGTDYHSAGEMRQARPEDIIAAMYDLGDLQPGAVALLSAFAVLPAESIGLEALEALLDRSPSDRVTSSHPVTQSDLETHLLALAQKGWIEHSQSDATFKCSPVVQEVVRKNNPRLTEDCRALVSGLVGALERETLHLDNYQQAAICARYGESVLVALTTPDQQLNVLCDRMGYYYQQVGDLGKALSIYERKRILVEKLLEEQPKNEGLKDSLATTVSWLGTVHSALGDLQQALTFFEKDIQLSKELHASFPGNVDFKNGLAISYSKLGETHSALGDLQQALTFFEEYSRLGKELHASFPGNVDFKNGLAISYSKLGETHSALGDLQQALTFFEDETRLFEELHASFPGNVSFKNGLAVSYSKLGDTHTALGDLQQALTFFEERSRLGKELHEAFPGNVSFKNGLAISYEKLGSTHTALGDLQQALTFFEDETRLFEELHESFPGNVAFKNGLAISYSKLGETHTALGDLQQALTFFERDIQLSKELHASFPGNVSFKNGLAISYEKLGSTHTALGDLQQALTFFEDETRLFEELHESFPGNVAFKNGLAISYSQLGRFFRDKKGDKEKAREHFQQCHRLWKELSEKYPSYVEFKRNFEWAENALAGL